MAKPKVKRNYSENLIMAWVAVGTVGSVEGVDISDSQRDAIMERFDMYADLDQPQFEKLILPTSVGNYFALKFKGGQIFDVIIKERK